MPDNSGFQVSLKSRFPVAPEKVEYLEGKAMELKKVLHDKIGEFVTETGHGFVITFCNVEDRENDMFTCRPCY